MPHHDRPTSLRRSFVPLSINKVGATRRSDQSLRKRHPCLVGPIRATRVSAQTELFSAGDTAGGSLQKDRKPSQVLASRARPAPTRRWAHKRRALERRAGLFRDAETRRSDNRRCSFL